MEASTTHRHSFPGRGHATHRQSHDTETGRRPWMLLVILCLAQFMVVLDITVVNVALPSIGESLSFGTTALSWVVTAYVLMAGGLILLGGRAADLLGRRRVFFAGLALFTLASLASGLATTPAMLITARAIQGVGAAMLTPAALSIIVTTYTGDRHAKALAAWAGVASAGAAAGMLLGGMLTTWFGWEWVFLINVPVGAAVAGFATRLIPHSEAAPAVGRKLDMPGALALISGLGVLIYALQDAVSAGWFSVATVSRLSVASLLLVAFARIETRSANPLVPPATWRSKSLVAGGGLMFGATGILVGLFFVNSIYLQEALGTSALMTGVEFLPIALSIGIAAHAAGHLLGRHGTRTVAMAGLTTVGAAALLLAIAPDNATFARDILPAFVLLGLGVGLAMPAAQVTAMSHIKRDEAGLASGLVMTGHEVGAAVGVAVLSAVAASAAGPGLAAGYGTACLVAAAVAFALVIIVRLFLPPVRPEHGARVGMH